jgi:hypothetical protein
VGGSVAAEAVALDVAELVALLVALDVALDVAVVETLFVAETVTVVVPPPPALTSLSMPPRQALTCAWVMPSS